MPMSIRVVSFLLGVLFSLGDFGIVALLTVDDFLALGGVSRFEFVGAGIGAVEMLDCVFEYIVLGRIACA